MSIPQSTSRVVVMPMYLSSDGKTEAGSGLSPTVKISKNGAAMADPNAGASTATNVSNNLYKFTLASQDTNTLDDLWVRFTEATCDPVMRLFNVKKATNGGLTAIPDTAVTTNNSLLTSGTGTDQLAVAAGKVLLQATQTGVTIPTVTTVTDKAGYSLTVTPPTSGETASAVATILLVDGSTNKLKVNPDNTVNATVSGTIVNYVTIPSAVAQASILAAQITAVRGDTLTVALPIMGILTGRTSLVFTAKKSLSDADSDAVLQVSESGGLLILNGSTSIVGTAQLSVTNATTGAVNLTLSAATTATIPLFDYFWDCQKVLSSGVSTPINGVLSVTGDVTRRLS